MTGRRDDIFGPDRMATIVCRYMGIGKPLTDDETQILLAALFNESKERGGVLYRRGWEKMNEKIAAVSNGTGASAE